MLCELFSLSPSFSLSQGACFLSLLWLCIIINKKDYVATYFGRFENPGSLEQERIKFDLAYVMIQSYTMRWYDMNVTRIGIVCTVSSVLVLLSIDFSKDHQRSCLSSPFKIKVVISVFLNIYCSPIK